MVVKKYTAAVTPKAKAQMTVSASGFHEGLWHLLAMLGERNPAWSLGVAKQIAEVGLGGCIGGSPIKGKHFPHIIAQPVRWLLLIGWRVETVSSEAGIDNKFGVVVCQCTRLHHAGEFCIIYQPGKDHRPLAGETTPPLLHSE